VSASDILREAADIVDGARGQTHGPRERAFVRAAAMWSAYLGTPVTPSDVCWMMTLLKAGRSKDGEPVRDHYVDGASYAALAGELSGAG